MASVSFKDWAEENAPELLEEWDYELNEKGPEEYNKSSTEQVNWISYIDRNGTKVPVRRKATISNRRRGFSKIKDSDYLNFKDWCDVNNPQLLKEWDYELNDKNPEDYGYGSGEIVHWIENIEENGIIVEHRWTAKIRARRNGRGNYNENKVIKINLKDWCIENGYTQILDKWDYKKNDLKPEDYGHRSKLKVFWIEKIDGENIQKSVEKSIRNVVDNEIKKQYSQCKNFKEWCEINNPKLLDEWDYELNKKSPEDYSYSSHEMVNWIIHDKKYGKDFVLKWKAKIQVRTIMHSSCPYITNQQVLEGYNDFLTYCKEMNLDEYLIQWSDKNKIQPNEIVFGYSKPVIWKCQICHGEFSVSPSSRISERTGCPYCNGKLALPGFNDFQTWLNNHSETAKLIDNEKNKNLKPQFPHILPNSKKYSINLKCDVCKYEWIKPVNQIITENGCPVCSGKIAKIGFNDLVTECINSHKEFLIKEWDTTNEKNMNEYTKGSNKKVGWICSECGNKWNAMIVSRMKGNGCPRCSSSHGEKKIKQFLDNNKINNIPQYHFSDCLSDFNVPLRFDFAIINENEKVKVLIEYDGEQHFKPVGFGEKNPQKILEYFKESQKRDSIKNDYCKKNNIPLIRIPYTEFENVEKILEKELNKLGILKMT